MTNPEGRDRRDFLALYNPTADNIAFSFGPFILEWFAGNRPSNQLPISAVCNSGCLFCSNHLNPFPIFDGIFRDIEDIKLQLCAMTSNDEPIHLSDSLPGRIAEGEALLHPRLFDILDLVRRKFFYNTLCFTTNGSMLDEAFLKTLASFRPIQITVSMHSTIPELWAKIFARKVQAAQTAIASVPLLQRFGMELVGAIVSLPRICGWDDIERTYEFFVANGAKSMILYWPGHTVRTPDALVKELECSLEEFTAFAGRMKGRFAIPVQPFPDMAAPLQIAVDTIIGKTLKGNPRMRGGAYRRVIWLSSRAAFPRLAKTVAEAAAGVPNQHHVVPADNRAYGGNIIAAGLLMTQDFIHAGLSALEKWPDADLFLVPSNPFDSLLRDLAGTPAHHISDGLGRPVWLVQCNGTVNSLLSLRLLERRKPGDPALKKAMDLFNFARADGEKLDSALDMVAEYPIATFRGLLDRNQLKAMLLEDRVRMPGSVPGSQKFAALDREHALCVETWVLRQLGESVQRWTRLFRKEQAWLIDSIEEGSAR